MLHYDARGDGPTTLFLLHGFLGSGRNLTSLARRLVEVRPELTVVLPDLRGHGVSPPLAPGADLNHLAEDVLELARHVGGTAPIELVGHSLGGRVALAATDLAPSAIARTVLLDISPSPFGALHGAMQRIFERLMGAPANMATRAAMRSFFIDGEVQGPLADWILTNFVPQAGGFAWRIDRAALADFHWREADADLWPLVPPHAAQLEVYYGGASPFVSPEMQAKLADAGVVVHELAGAVPVVHGDALEPLAAHPAAGPAAP